MKMKVLFVALSLGLCAFSTLAQTDQLSIAVDKMPDQPLPVVITTSHLQNFQYASQLSVEYDVEKATEPESVSFMLILYRDGKVIAGEGWEETSPTGSVFRDTKLAIKPGEKALLIVTSVKSRSRTWKLNDHDLMEQMHSLIEGRQPLSLPVEVSMRTEAKPKIILAQGSQAACEADLNAAQVS